MSYECMSDLWFSSSSSKQIWTWLSLLQVFWWTMWGSFLSEITESLARSSLKINTLPDIQNLTSCLCACFFQFFLKGKFPRCLCNCYQSLPNFINLSLLFFIWFCLIFSFHHFVLESVHLNSLLMLRGENVLIIVVMCVMQEPFLISWW